MCKQLALMGATILLSVLVWQEVSLAKVKIDNVAIVAPSAGDYSNPAVAMADLANWCNAPSSTNPCLLQIMPGLYDVGSTSVVMHEYVDIEGSGENVTKIKGNIGTSGFVRQGVIVGASNAEIRYLTVVNESTSGVDAVAISYEFASPQILHLSAVASGGTGDNVAIYINSGTSPISLKQVTAKASGGTNSYGVAYIDCTPALTNVDASAAGATGNNYGVFDGNDAGSFATIEQSVLAGTSGSLLSVGFGSAHIATSRLIGSVHVGGDPYDPAPVCAGVYDRFFTFYAATCP